MEGLIVLGLIIWGVVSLFSNNKCKDGHDWVSYNDIHSCAKCGKEEKHDYTYMEEDHWAGGTYARFGCSVCGCNHAWDND